MERRITLATIRMSIAERNASVSIPVSTDPMVVVDIAGAAGTLADAGAAAVQAQALANGQTISCGPGCGACCRQIVAISVVEAAHLARVVERMPSERRDEVRRRFADGLARLESAGLLDPRTDTEPRHLVYRDLDPASATTVDVGRRYFALKIACPFLENESCGIYADRPMVCRHHLVTTPAVNCSHLFDQEVQNLPYPFHMGQILSRLAERRLGIEHEMVPILLSLEWAEGHPDLRSQQFAGRELFQDMMNLLQGPAEDAPFESPREA